MKIYRWQSQKTGAVKWGVDYRDPSGRRVQRIVATNKKDAEKIAAKITSEMELGEYYDRAQIEEVNLGEMITRYKAWFQTKDSYATECYHLAAIESHFGAKVLISAITEEDVKRFVNARLEVPSRNSSEDNPRPRSNATINRELWALKRLLYKAVDWSLLRSNPAKKVEPLEEPKKRISYLTQDEGTSLLDAARDSRNPHLHAILLIALETGARREEILHIRHQDVDARARLIHFPTTKNGKERYVPISDNLLPVLQAVPRRIDSDYLFAGTDGEPFHDVRTGFEVACRKAGIPATFRFHDLRHTFVTHALDAGAPPNVVAEIVGHTLVAMLDKYGHVLAERKIQAVNNLPSWGKVVA